MRAGSQPGAPFAELPITVTDRSSSSYEHARREAQRAWAKQLGIDASRITILGVF